MRVQYQNLNVFGPCQPESGSCQKVRGPWWSKIVSCPPKTYFQLTNLIGGKAELADRLWVCWQSATHPQLSHTYHLKPSCKQASDFCNLYATDFCASTWYGKNLPLIVRPADSRQFSECSICVLKVGETSSPVVKSWMVRQLCDIATSLPHLTCERVGVREEWITMVCWFIIFIDFHHWIR